MKIIKKCSPSSFNFLATHYCRIQPAKNYSILSHNCVRTTIFSNKNVVQLIYYKEFVFFRREHYFNGLGPMEAGMAKVG